MPLLPFTGAAATKGAIVPLGNARITSTTASVTFSNIPQIYTDLMLIGFARSTWTGDAFDGIGIYPNNNFSTANTSLGRLYQNRDASAAFGINTGLVGLFGWRITPSFVANGFTTQRYHIFNYASTNMFKTAISEGTAIGEGLPENVTVSTIRDNAAITTLTLQSDRGTGNSQLAAGTVFTLYGIRSVGQ